MARGPVIGPGRQARRHDEPGPPEAEREQPLGSALIPSNGHTRAQGAGKRKLRFKLATYAGRP